MAWMIGADKTIVANDGNSKLSSSPDICCIHTIVGAAPASAAHFSTNGAGKIWQHRDTIKQSAANYYGNNHIIAIENEDRSAYFPSWDKNDGHAVPGFTNAQIEAIAQICAWANKTHGIPLVQCPDSKRGSRGIAYHRQGIDGNWAGYAYSGRVAGGEVWTTSPGKVCPGDRRIAQIPQIIERARQIVGLGGDDLTPDEHMWLKGISDVLGAYYTASGGKQIGQAIWEIEQAIGDAYKLSNGKSIGQLVVTLNTAVAAISEKLNNVTTPDVDEVQVAQLIVTELVNRGVLTTEQVIEAVKQANKEQWSK